MDYELAATIAGAILALLFLLYARNKKRGVKVNKEEELLRNPDEPQPEPEPDVISKTAGGIVKAHHFFQKVMGFIFIGVILVMTIFDPMVRMIVILTVVVMLVIALIHLGLTRRKYRRK